MTIGFQQLQPIFMNQALVGTALDNHGTILALFFGSMSGHRSLLPTTAISLRMLLDPSKCSLFLVGVGKSCNVFLQRTNLPLNKPLVGLLDLVITQDKT